MTRVFWFILLVPLVAGEEEECFYCIRPSCNPSITGVPAEAFDPSADAELLRGAMNGVGTHEETLINILTTRSEIQRQAIANIYVTQGNTMAGDIKHDTSCSFKTLVVALATPLLSFYTEQLGKATKEDDRSVAIEILTTLPPCVIRKMANKYPEMFKGRNMIDDVQGFKLGDVTSLSNSEYNELMKNLAEGNREKDLRVDEDRALADATKLKAAGVDRAGTDEDIFIDVFTKRSIPQLAATIRKYEELRKNDDNFKSLEKDIESEFSEHIEDALIALATNARDQPLYFARELHEVLEKWFKSDEDEEKLIRIIRGRCDIDLEDIKRAYKSEFKVSLYEALEGNFKTLKSDYKKTLLAVVKNTEEITVNLEDNTERK